MSNMMPSSPGFSFVPFSLDLSLPTREEIGTSASALHPEEAVFYHEVPLGLLQAEQTKQLQPLLKSLAFDTILSPFSRQTLIV